VVDTDTPRDVLPVVYAGKYMLRRWEERDLPLLEEAAQDPLIPAISSVPSRYTMDAGRAFIDLQQRRLRDGFGYSYVIAIRDDASAVGSIGLWLRDVDQGRASLGYWVVPSQRRRGAARAALAALTRWASGPPLAIPRLELYVEPWNEASVRTAEAAGYTREGLLRQWQEVEGARRDMYIYSAVGGDDQSDPAARGTRG